MKRKRESESERRKKSKRKGRKQGLHLRVYWFHDISHHDKSQPIFRVKFFFQSSECVAGYFMPSLTELYGLVSVISTKLE